MLQYYPHSRTCAWCDQVIGKGRLCLECAALDGDIRRNRMRLAWQQLRQISWREPGSLHLLMRRIRLLIGIIWQYHSH